MAIKNQLVHEVGRTFFEEILLVNFFFNSFGILSFIMARPPEVVYSWTDITSDFKASVKGEIHTRVFTFVDQV
jgi:hypothetical protein